MAGEYTGIHRLQEFDAANYAVATLVASCSAASFASGKLLQQYWKTQFQYFGVSDTRVGHVRVYRIAAAAFLLQE